MKYVPETHHKKYLWKRFKDGTDGNTPDEEEDDDFDEEQDEEKEDL
jgi:hypothetical protein